MSKATNPTATSKADKFRALAEKRVNNALKQLDGIAKLANKSNYDFTEQQVTAITGVLSERVEVVSDRFTRALEGKTSPNSAGFKL